MMLRTTNRSGSQIPFRYLYFAVMTLLIYFAVQPDLVFAELPGLEGDEPFGSSNQQPQNSGSSSGMTWKVWLFLILFSLLPIGLFYWVFDTIRSVFRGKKSSPARKRIDQAKDKNKLDDNHRFYSDADDENFN